MTDKEKVGESGVDSMIAGLNQLALLLHIVSDVTYPARIEESVRFPELSEVRKT
jgi:hypothetical protein